MQSLFSRAPSSSSINPAPSGTRDREFIERAVVTRRRRPHQHRSSWFTRRRLNRVIPVVDEEILTAPKAQDVEPILVAMPRMPSIPLQNSDGSKKYPSVTQVDLSEFPDTDIASEMPYGVAEVVGQDGRSCCLPGRYVQDCRICPERMQPPREKEILVHTKNPSAVQPEQRESGGRKKRKKTIRRGRKRQLKKRHYRKSRKH